MSGLTHFDAGGSAHMVDVGDKAVTHRIAVAAGRIRMLPATFALVRDGEADAAIADYIAARAALRAQPGLVIRGKPLTDESFTIAVRRNDPQLYTAVNGVLNALRGEGWLAALADRWL